MLPNFISFPASVRLVKYLGNVCPRCFQLLMMGDFMSFSFPWNSIEQQNLSKGRGWMDDTLSSGSLPINHVRSNNMVLTPHANLRYMYVGVTLEPRVPRLHPLTRNGAWYM